MTKKKKKPVTKKSVTKKVAAKKSPILAGADYGYPIVSKKWTSNPAVLSGCTDVIGSGRTGHATGWKPNSPSWKCGQDAPIFEERPDPIARSDWKEIIDLSAGAELSKLATHQWDQNGEGTCTANAAASGYHYMFASQFGKENVPTISPISLYKFCASGPNTGSAVSCIVRRLRDYGGIPIDNEANRRILTKMGCDPSHVLKAVGYYQSMPGGWQETAKHFQLEEYYDIATSDGLFSALLQGFTVHVGRSGHSIIYVDPVYRDGSFAVRYHNSWGNWGDNGYGYDTESYIKRSGAYRGAVAYRSLLYTPAFDALFE